MNPIHERFLTVSAIFVFVSLMTSLYLIYMHQKNMCRLSIQPKIVGILWMVPIYSVSSFISLVNPSSAISLDMVRDCYEAYVLYLFLALMLSYLDAEQDEYSIIQYLDENGPFYLPKPLSYCFPSPLPQGKAFLRYCKFGTLQYCVIRPLATVIAFILDSCGVYHESSFSFQYGYLYITLAVNLSIAYAFVVLVAFYTSLKDRLKPFKPVGKFLCIKFVIFFSFWQSIVIAILVRVGLIQSIDSYYSANLLASSYQDFLICFEMMLVALAHLHVFSYKPFTPEGQYTEFMLGRSMRHNDNRKILFINNHHLHGGDVEVDQEEEEEDSSEDEDQGSGQGSVTYEKKFNHSNHYVLTNSNNHHSSSSNNNKYSSHMMNPWLQKKLENAALSNSNNGLAQDLLKQHRIEEKQLRRHRRAERQQHQQQQHQQQQKELFVSATKYRRHQDNNHSNSSNSAYIPPDIQPINSTVTSSSSSSSVVKNNPVGGNDDDDDDTVEVLLSSSGIQQSQQQQQSQVLPLDGGSYSYITQSIINTQNSSSSSSSSSQQRSSFKRKSKTEPMLLEPQSPPSPVQRHFSLFPQPQRSTQQQQLLQRGGGGFSQSQLNKRRSQPPQQSTSTRRPSIQSTLSAASASVTEVLNRHFASSSAVRDFNETMPVTILPVSVSSPATRTAASIAANTSGRSGVSQSGSNSKNTSVDQVRNGSNSMRSSSSSSVITSSSSSHGIMSPNGRLGSSSRSSGGNGNMDDDGL